MCDFLGFFWWFFSLGRIFFKGEVIGCVDLGLEIVFGYKVGYFCLGLVVCGVGIVRYLFVGIKRGSF